MSACNDVVNQDLLELLKKLIEIDSVNPDSGGKATGEQVISEWIAMYLEQIGLEVQKQEVNSQRSNVIGILRGSGGGRSLMLNGHMDTVGIRDMKIDPFNPRYENGKVYGRGSYDMKGGLAAILMSAQILANQPRQLTGDLILSCVVDEEYANLGTEVLVKNFSADAAIVCEPTELEIGVAHKGWGWERINVYGRAAHGSMPEKGIDAVMKAAKLLRAIEEMGTTVLAKKNHPMLGFPSIHAGQIKGGSSELNTYPGHCVVELERRTIPGETRETVLGEMEGILETLKSEDPEFKADLDLFLYRSALETPEISPIVSSLKKGYHCCFDKLPVVSGFSGWADSATLSEAGIPAVLFGPSGEGAHAPVEWVDFESVVGLTNVLVSTARDFCGCYAEKGLTAKPVVE